MVCHQAIGVTKPIEAPNHFRQHSQKFQPIVIIFKDRFATIAT
jgi:hypothetical protein